MVRTVSTLILLISGHAMLHAGQPYGLSLGVDLPMAVGLTAMKYNSGSMLAETRLSRQSPATLNRNDIPAWDRWAIGNYSPTLSAASSVVSAAIMAVPVAVNLWDTYKGETSWTAFVVDAVILQEALMLSGALSSYSKSIPMHATPLSYDPNVPETEKNKPQNASSFFSNHTTSAFTAAVFSAYTFQLRHPDSKLVPWVWGGTMALATGVGSMRVMAGKHFASDVVAGAAVGALCGYIVPWLHTGRNSFSGHRDRPTKDKDGKKRVNWEMGVSVPEGTTAAGPNLTVRF